MQDTFSNPIWLFYTSLLYTKVSRCASSICSFLTFCKKSVLHFIIKYFGMASKPINIHWIGPVPSHTEKSCILSYFGQLPTNNKIKIIVKGGVWGVEKFFWDPALL